MVITLSEFLTILAIKILKIFNFGYKMGILKMLSKNSVNSVSSTPIWCISFYGYSFTSRPTRSLNLCRIEYKLSTEHVHEVSYLGQYKGQFGLCYNPVWPSFTFRIERALKFSRLNQFGPRDIFPCWLELWYFQSWVKWLKGYVHARVKFWNYTRALIGQCWDHVCPLFSFWLPRALKLSILRQPHMLDMTTDCLFIMLLGLVLQSFKYLLFIAFK